MPNYCECGCGLFVQCKGAYRKGHNPPGVDRDPGGRIKEYNDISNPIYRAKKQKREHEEAVERIKCMPNDEGVMSAEAAQEFAKTILNAPANSIVPERILKQVTEAMDLDDLSDEATFDQVLDLSEASFYVGYTGQGLEDEALRWLTLRGSEKLDEVTGDYIPSGTRNRPVLLYPDDSTISMTKAQTHLGFVYFEVYASTLKINARAVEKALQVLKMALPLGRRLWRCADKGSKFDKEIDGKVHKVYITISPRIGSLIAKGEIKINY